MATVAKNGLQGGAMLVLSIHLVDHMCNTCSHLRLPIGQDKHQRLIGSMAVDTAPHPQTLVAMTET